MLSFLLPQMDPDSRPMFSQAAVILQSIDLSTADNIEPTDLIKRTMPESSLKNAERTSVSDSNRRAIKNWRRHSSCSDPGDAVSENKGDSGIDPGVFFSEQSKKRLSSSCGRLIAKMEEFTTFEELETYLRSYTNSATVGKEDANVEDTTVPCSPSEHAKSNQTTSPQSVTPSICKTNKPHLPDPSTPYAPPPTPCTSKIRPAVSLPLLKDTDYDEMLPQVTSSDLSSNEINPCVRRRRTDVKSHELFTSPSTNTPTEAVLSSGINPELSDYNPNEFSCDDQSTPDNKTFPYNLYPKQVTPNITIASSIDSI